MTAEDILRRHDEDTLVFTGQELDELRAVFRPRLGSPQSDWLRDATKVIAVRVPRAWLDEIPRLCIGETLGREWLIEEDAQAEQSEAGA